MAQQVEVCGTSREPSNERLPSSLRRTTALYQVDLADSRAVAKLIDEVRPDLIAHLAAQADVYKSWTNPAETIVNNIVGELNILQGVIATGTNPVILIPGSNEEYGFARPEELPVRESNPLRPINPYGVSKVAQDMLAYQYFASHKLRCIRVRPFNHIGPRQSAGFVVSAFAKQIAQIEAGLQEPVVRVGNLAAKRDFTDVRDVVRAYHLLLLHGEPGEVYNLGSGRSVPIASILAMLIALAKVPIATEVDPERLRPLDLPETLCDYTKLHERTGWEPQIPIEQTLADTLNYWREVIG